MGDIDEDGSVYVDGELLDEPYVEEKALGTCNIELPYQSRTDAGSSWEITGRFRWTAGPVGGLRIRGTDCGPLTFRLWPLNRIGPVSMMVEV